MKIWHLFPMSVNALQKFQKIVFDFCSKLNGYFAIVTFCCQIGYFEIVAILIGLTYGRDSSG